MRKPMVRPGWAGRRRLIAAACGTSTTASNTGTASKASSSPSAPASPAAASSAALKTTTISGTKVLTNAKGFTLYWFGPDMATKSNCNGSCAHYWPPVKGPAAAGTGVTGKLSTITAPTARPRPPTTDTRSTPT